MNILEEADNLINGDRAADYGDVSDNFERIAKLWGAYRGQFFDRHDVAQMMILVKVARQASGYHRDSNVDIAGYAALDEQCHDRINESYQRSDQDHPVEKESIAGNLTQPFEELILGLYEGLPFADLDDEECCDGCEQQCPVAGPPADWGLDDPEFSPVLQGLMADPVQPRVWDTWESVPVYLVVRDVDGDLWIKTGTSYMIQWAGEGPWFLDSQTDGIRPNDADAPFTEVVG